VALAPAGRGGGTTRASAGRGGGTTCASAGRGVRGRLRGPRS